VSDWVSNNISLLTLIITTILAITTLVYTLITRRMLSLASQPTIAIRPLKVSIIPDLPTTTRIGENEDDLENCQCCLAFWCELINIGNQPAQNIYFDAEAHFKVSRPLGIQVLPLHYPEFVSFLPSKSNDADKPVGVSAQFSNYVGRELIRDFIKGRVDMVGMAFLPSRTEMEDRSLWPSPKIAINCFYSDIQGQHFVSQIELFFHIWKNEEQKKLDIYILNMQELQFVGIKRVTERFRDNYIKKYRSLRYSSFSGKQYSENDLLLLASGGRQIRHAEHLAQQSTTKLESE
jgi:hypothetical protein